MKDSQIAADFLTVNFRKWSFQGIGKHTTDARRKVREMENLGAKVK